MKFLQIKEGDIVYIRKDIVYKKQETHTFFIPVEVKTVTSTEIHIGKGKYKINTGKKIDGGMYHRIYFEGEMAEGFSNRVVKDESEEMYALKDRISEEHRLNNMIRKLGNFRGSGLDLDTLDNLASLINSIQELKDNFKEV